MTTIDRIAALFGCFLLAGTLWQQLAPHPVASDLVRPTDPDPAPVPALPSLADLQAVADRNLFAPDRIRRLGPSPLGNGLEFELVGIARSGGEASASFRLQDGRTISVALARHADDSGPKGNLPDGWTVAAIDHDQVLLRKNGQTATLSMKRKPDAAAPSTPSDRE